uniref:Uncharacterized protein n=1 Tax=Tanacetum cinerariifolium TaxID=118510 RepID=A0A699HKY6_TANCI|nr:hypothetical protein [Tanacetum cinerariifolium]
MTNTSLNLRLTKTSKGKAPSKGSKTDKFAFAKEPVKEHIDEVVMDDGGEDMVHDAAQTQHSSQPKKDKTSEWFKQPPRPPTPDPELNKCQAILDRSAQPWFNQMVSASKDPLTFDSLMATIIDFSKFVLNRFKIDNLTQDLLLGPAYNLLKEGDFVNLHLNDIEYMLLLATQHKLFHLNDCDIVDFTMALQMFTRSLIVKRQAKDLQLGVKRYKKKLNITAPQRTFDEIDCKEIYTPSYNSPGAVYEDQNQQKRMMRADELYKFSDETL